LFRTLTDIPQESLKDGMDLSTSINRLRFDGLAAGVYRQVGAKLTSTVKEAGLDISQIDEVLLAGSSTLFPGLQSHLSLLVSPTTPVTSTIDPSEVIAVGCALSALHLSTLEEGLKLNDVLEYGQGEVDTLSAPIGVALPGSEGTITKILEKGAPLPLRRRVAFPVFGGVEKVALEIWEGKDEVKVEKVERSPRDQDDDDDDDEEDEDEETKTPITVRTKALGGVELGVKGGKQVVLEIVVQRGGGLEVRAWEEGREDEVASFEA
jgi:heat shock protein 1/8